MTALRIDSIGKSFAARGSELVAIRSVSLAVEPGEFLAIVGPSGCGKSTLLQIVAGLISPSAGRIWLGEQDVTGQPAHMVYLFQQYAKSLLPWQTVEGNVMFSFSHRLRLSRSAARERCRAYLEMVGLAEFGLHYPWQLSGGMQQRVAIARALAAEPQVLLLDEPFSSVDALTRMELHALILDLWAQKRFTAVLVTHDVDEAIFLADRVAVLSRRPATVSEVVETNLPRPREPVETHENPNFLKLRHRLLGHLLAKGRGPMRAQSERLLRALPGVAFPTLLLLALEAAVRSGFADRSFIPAPSAVAERIGGLLISGVAGPPLLKTTLLLFTGYGLGCLAAIVLGILMGYYRPVYLLLEPITELVRPIPKPALVPVLMLLLGLGAGMKVTVVALAAFFPVLINTVQGVRAVDPVLTDMARNFGHSGAAVLWRILLPASAPYILAGMRISLGIALVVVIVAEMISSTGGLGDLILDMQRSFRVTDSYAWLVIVAVLGFGLNILFRWAERRATFWSAAGAD